MKELLKRYETKEPEIVFHWNDPETEAEGWTVYRIKVDDGCYEVKGRDPEGNLAEASFRPASLILMDMEREEEDDDDDDDSDGDYRTKVRDGGQGTGETPVPRNGVVKGRPSVTVE